MPAAFALRRPAGVLSSLAMLIAASAVDVRAGQRQVASVVPDVSVALARAAERVEDFFERAQSLVCTETVHIQPLSSGLSGDGFGRTVESELRLSWEPGEDGAAATEAQALRQVTRVNGHPPKKNDYNNCTTQERHDTETQVLSLLLASQRGDYTWKSAGTGKVDNRPALLVDFSEKEKLSLEITDLDDKECMSFMLRGGTRGRLWIDAESFDVLRLDTRLSGQASAMVPKALRRKMRGNPNVMVERLESTYRFRRLQFQDPPEAVVLPVSSSTLKVVHSPGPSRSRVTTEYKQYRRFLTAGRIVPPDPPDR